MQEDEFHSFWLPLIGAGVAVVISVLLSLLLYFYHLLHLTYLFVAFFLVVTGGLWIISSAMEKRSIRNKSSQEPWHKIRDLRASVGMFGVACIVMYAYIFRDDIASPFFVDAMPVAATAISSIMIFIFLLTTIVAMREMLGHLKSNRSSLE